jgi:hypothetical protein
MLATKFFLWEICPSAKKFLNCWLRLATRLELNITTGTFLIEFNNASNDLSGVTRHNYAELYMNECKKCLNNVVYG